MKEFFEQIRGFTPGRNLLAAWVFEGAGTGGKALFAEDGNRWVPFVFDDTFPKDFIPDFSLPGVRGYSVITVEGQRIFLERICGRKKLVVCGAGHVSMPIIRMGKMLGYEITVIEDRSEFAEKAKASGADHIIVEPFEKALEELPDRPWTAYIVVTRGHSHDVDSLRKILKKEFAYAGMMGSRRRTAMIREQLLEEGYPEEKVNLIHMPIGLSIGSRTPEEIAVSILAEVIETMNMGMPEEGFPENMVEKICTLLQDAERNGIKGPAGILALIVEKQGEAPRQPGTKMLIYGENEFAGSVGGGVAEAEILGEARKMLREGCLKSVLRSVSMKKGMMQCGGEISVLLMPLIQV